MVNGNSYKYNNSVKKKVTERFLIDNVSKTYLKSSPTNIGTDVYGKHYGY